MAVHAGSLLQGTASFTLPNDGGVVTGTFTTTIDDGLDAGVADAGKSDAGAAATDAGTGAVDAGTSAVLRIMPLGDSMTAGFNGVDGYRYRLWQDTQAAGMGIDFVGSLQSGNTAFPDRDHEGHSGLRTDQLDAIAAPFITQYNPDVILLLIGANDIFQGVPITTASARLETFVKHIAATTKAKLLVGSIPPQRTPYRALVDPYNQAVLAICTRLAATQSIQYVDVSAGLTLDYTDIDSDNLHPTPASYTKIADHWFTALTTRTARHVRKATTKAKPRTPHAPH